MTGRIPKQDDSFPGRDPCPFTWRRAARGVNTTRVTTHASALRRGVQGAQAVAALVDQVDVVHGP
ncbi:hypothetical protein, partial [Nguyenibacter vanlangensis]|uniref:hypothetical protein n=1 Tax=Nguyenibacter vanlangensis TaxID=1216886 RepID=UPI001C3FF85F